jgi:hypothetical protein
MSATRQPPEAVRLIVEIVGNTVLANGRLTIFSTTGGGVDEYVVQDRTLATKWAIKVIDGILSITASSSMTSDEPVVEDNLVPGLKWKIFVDDGEIGIESSAETIEEVILNDGSATYELIVSDGMLGIELYIVDSEVFTFSENGVKIGSNELISVDGITISGISDGFVKINAINRIGQPVNQQISVQNNVPVRFYSQKGRIKMHAQGQELISDYKVMAEPDLDIQENDVIYPISDVIGMTVGVVNFVERIFDFAGVTHHTEAGIDIS